MKFSFEEIEDLKKTVKARLSEKRYNHTLGVEDMAKKLSSFILPDMQDELCAAALLHDVCKEYKEEELLEFIKRGGGELSEEELSSPAILHSLAAPFIIKRDFARFATENVLSACKNHTLGDGGMSDFDSIIFISDFIETGRKNDSSARVRAALFEGLSGDKECSKRALYQAVIAAIDSTISYLERNGKTVNSKALFTKTAFLNKI